MASTAGTGGAPSTPFSTGGILNAGGAPALGVAAGARKGKEGDDMSVDSRKSLSPPNQSKMAGTKRANKNETLDDEDGGRVSKMQRQEDGTKKKAQIAAKVTFKNGWFTPNQAGKPQAIPATDELITEVGKRLTSPWTYSPMDLTGTNVQFLYPDDDNEFVQVGAKSVSPCQRREKGCKCAGKCKFEGFPKNTCIQKLVSGICTFKECKQRHLVYAKSSDIGSRAVEVPRTEKLIHIDSESVKKIMKWKDNSASANSAQQTAGALNNEADKQELYLDRATKAVEGGYKPEDQGLFDMLRVNCSVEEKRKKARQYSAEARTLRKGLPGKKQEPKPQPPKGRRFSPKKKR